MYDVVGQQNQRRARVGNGFVRSLSCLPVDRETAGRELPEALRGVDRYEVDAAREFSLVDEAEVVVARYVCSCQLLGSLALSLALSLSLFFGSVSLTLPRLQVGCEERHGQFRHRAREEGLLLRWLNLVDRIHGKT